MARGSRGTRAIVLISMTNGLTKKPKPKKPKRKVGRPKKEINLTLVEDLAMIQCTQQEIADIVGVSLNTLKKQSQFLTLYKKGQTEGKKSLRRKQFEKAGEGNTTMLIWLGKQYLGQRDFREAEGVVEKKPDSVEWIVE